MGDRADYSSVIIFPDPATFAWWGKDEFSHRFRVFHKTFYEVTKALELRRPIDITRSYSAACELYCGFDDSVITPDNLGTVESVPYKVNVYVPGTPDYPCQLITYSNALKRLHEIAQWLETDPVIDGLTIGQHRAIKVTERLRNQMQQEHETAEALAADPAFSAKEAKAVLQSMRDYVISEGGSGLQVKRFVWRDGTGSRSTRSLYCSSETVRQKGGGWTNRVTYRWDTWDKRPDKMAHILRDLQEKFSYAKTLARWEDD